MAKGNKTGGRRKGTPNKVTSEIREVYKDIIEKNLNNIDTWLKKVSEDNPAKALNFIIRFSEYVIPKLQSTEFTSIIDLEKLSEKELDLIIDRLKNETES